MFNKHPSGAKKVKAKRSSISVLSTPSPLGLALPVVPVIVSGASLIATTTLHRFTFCVTQSLLHKGTSLTLKQQVSRPQRSNEHGSSLGSERCTLLYQVCYLTYPMARKGAPQLRCVLMRGCGSEGVLKTTPWTMPISFIYSVYSLFRRLNVNWNCLDIWFWRLSMNWNCPDNWFRRLSIN